MPLKKILIVDDKWSIRNSLVIGLQRNGYAVDSANNAQNALFKLNDFQYDFLLTDIKMPELNGLALADIVNELHPNIRIILMTGHDFHDTQTNFLQERKYPLLAKPIKFMTLLKLLTN